MEVTEYHLSRWQRFVNRHWRLKSAEFRFIVVVIPLAVLGMYGFKSLITWDTTGRPCHQYGELWHVNTKSIGFQCYVEYRPGQWVDKFTFEMDRDEDYHRAVGSE